MGIFGNNQQQNTGTLNLGVGQPGQMPVQSQNPFAPQNGMMQQMSQNLSWQVWWVAQVCNKV